MKVLQINAIYGTKSTGTIVKEIQQISVLNGIDSYVAYSTSPLGKYEVPYGYKIGGLFSQKCHALLSRISGKQAYFSYFATWKFLRWINNLKPDVIHLHNLHSNYINLNLLLGYLAKKRIPTIITMHDCWYFTGGCFHYTGVACNKWIIGCGDCPKRLLDTPAYLYDASSEILKDRIYFLSAIPRLYMVGCSDWIAKEASKSFLSTKNIRCIYNGFDSNVFKPMMSDLAQSLGIDGKFIILGPATKWLSSINSYTYKSFVSQMSDDCILLLFGADRTDLSFDRNVVLYKYTRNVEEMVRLYSVADVFVNCSREDTLSSLNIESQFCGTPVVTYEATGSRETVDGICGFAVETGNAEQLWFHVEKIRSITKRNLTEQCRKWVMSKFEKVSNYQKYIDLYNEVKKESKA